MQLRPRYFANSPVTQNIAGPRVRSHWKVSSPKRVNGSYQHSYSPPVRRKCKVPSPAQCEKACLLLRSMNRVTCGLSNAHFAESALLNGRSRLWCRPSNSVHPVGCLLIGPADVLQGGFVGLLGGVAQRAFACFVAEIRAAQVVADAAGNLAQGRKRC